MKEDKLIPKRRFKEFENDGAWERWKLGDVTNIKTGSSDLKDADANGEYPFFVRSENIERSSRYIFEGEAILIPGEGRIGDIYHYINGKFDYHQRVYKISDFEDLIIDGKFVLYYLQQNFKRHALKFTVKATVDSLRLPMLVDFEIKIPGLEEQRRISAFFSNLDNLITLHQRKLKKLKETKSAYLSEMFPKEGEKYPKRRFAGFTDPWEDRKFDKEVEFYSGLTYSPGNVCDKGTLVLRSSNVKNGEIVDADNVYVNPDVVNSCNVKEEDIIVVVRNGSRSLIGKHAQIKRTMKNTVIGAFMTGVRSNQSCFINALMDTQQFNKEIEKNLGATINQITNRMFCEMEFMFPSEKEQEKVGAFFEQFDNLITLHQRKLEKLENIKKAYLNEMFV